MWYFTHSLPQLFVDNSVRTPDIEPGKGHFYFQSVHQLFYSLPLIAPWPWPPACERTSWRLACYARRRRKVSRPVVGCEHRPSLTGRESQTIALCTGLSCAGSLQPRAPLECGAEGPRKRSVTVHLCKFLVSLGALPALPPLTSIPSNTFAPAGSAREMCLRIPRAASLHRPVYGPRHSGIDSRLASVGRSGHGENPSPCRGQFNMTTRRACRHR